MSLYNLCDLDTAFLFDHAKGHTLPRDRETVKELGDTIRTMCSSILTDWAEIEGSIGVRLDQSYPVWYRFTWRLWYFPRSTYCVVDV